MRITCKKLPDPPRQLLATMPGEVLMLTEDLHGLNAGDIVIVGKWPNGGAHYLTRLCDGIMAKDSVSSITATRYGFACTFLAE